MGVNEFQAFVMAGGKGSRMTELTIRRPKCLLPIGNFPMVWYPINLLERSGFQEVTVIVLESIKSEVQAALDHTGLKIHVEVFGIPVGEDWGTADTLRHLEENNKIKSDVVVVPCDVVTDLDLSALLNQFRQHDASLASLFSQPTPAKVALATPGPKSKEKLERDLVAIEPATSRLVFLASASDYEETLSLPRRLLKKHGRVRLYSRLIDAHVYVMKKWLCKYLTHNRNMSTLKGELVPYAVKKQNIKPPSCHDKASVVISTPKTELIELAEEQQLITKVRLLSHNPDVHEDVIRCYATIAPENSFTARANTLQEYCRLNREIVERWPEVCGGIDLVPVASSASVSSQQLELQTCLVGEGATVAERTAIRSSILGPQTCIRSRTRVFNSILMAGATVGEGCAIVNCVLCDDAVVEDGCDLKDCLVGSRHVVPAGEKHSNEVLTDDDHLLEIV